jgi:hypothetical protein
MVVTSGSGVVGGFVPAGTDMPVPAGTAVSAVFGVFA